MKKRMTFEQQIDRYVGNITEKTPPTSLIRDRMSPEIRARADTLTLSKSERKRPRWHWRPVIISIAVCILVIACASFVLADYANISIRRTEAEDHEDALAPMPQYVIDLENAVLVNVKEDYGAHTIFYTVDEASVTLALNTIDPNHWANVDGEVGEIAQLPLTGRKIDYYFDDETVMTSIYLEHSWLHITMHNGSPELFEDMILALKKADNAVR